MTARKDHALFLGGCAREVADRVAFMDEGRIIDIAPPTDFFITFRRTARTIFSVRSKAVGSVRSDLSDKRYHRFYRTNAHGPGRHGA
jgi:ABC-type sulfate/molybdate transport systems ATPase subunit